MQQMFQSFMQCDAEEIQKRMSSTDLNGCAKYKGKKKDEKYGKLLISKNCLESLLKACFFPKHILFYW